MLNNARSLSDLAVPANNRPKAARRERLGQHSIGGVRLTPRTDQPGGASRMDTPAWRALQRTVDVIVTAALASAGAPL
jgi:hypothetical protein